MKCIQCKVGIVATELIQGYSIETCADGHRSGRLSAAQVSEIESRVGVRVASKAAKGGRKAAKATGLVYFNGRDTDVENQDLAENE